MKQLKLHPNHIHIAHQSEVIKLKKQMATMQMRLDRLGEILLKQDSTPIQLNQKIKIPIENGFSRIDKASIIYCKAEGNYTRIITSKEQYFVSKTIKYIEMLLDSPLHFRCHQSYLVNLNYINSVVTLQNSTITVIDEERIPVSRRKKKGLMQALNG